jgi:hypothetical protein
MRTGKCPDHNEFHPSKSDFVMPGVDPEDDDPKCASQESCVSHGWHNANTIQCRFRIIESVLAGASVLPGPVLSRTFIDDPRLVATACSPSQVNRSTQECPPRPTRIASIIAKGTTATICVLS